MWQNSALVLGAIFASVWGGQSQLDIIFHQGTQKRNVPSQLEVDEGTYFKLQCTLASPFLGGDLVWKAVGNIPRAESDELSFQPVRLEDRGEYLCLDRNGNTYKSVVLNVAPKPHGVEDLSPPLRDLYQKVRKIAKEEKQNLLGVPIPPEDKDYPNDEGYQNNAENPAESLKVDTEAFLASEENGDVEEKLTVAPSAEKDANEDVSKTSTTTAAHEDESHETEPTTTTKMEEYVEDFYNDYEEPEADAPPDHKDEETTKDATMSPVGANFRYTVDKNNGDEAVVFDHHEPNLLNRFGGAPIGLDDIYADYFDGPASVQKEHETVEEPVEEFFPPKSGGLRKDWAALNMNDFNIPLPEQDKELSAEEPEQNMELAAPTEGVVTMPSMESSVGKINQEVHDMLLFKYIVYALLLILVILLLAFIIRIWHLLEYKSSNDYPTPATQYVKLPQPVALPTVEDGTESLLP